MSRKASQEGFGQDEQDKQRPALLPRRPMVVKSTPDLGLPISEVRKTSHEQHEATRKTPQRGHGQKKSGSVLKPRSSLGLRSCPFVPFVAIPPPLVAFDRHLRNSKPKVMAKRKPQRLETKKIDLLVSGFRALP
jgi:hypothetical protein